MRFAVPDEAIATDQPARVLSKVIETLDLSAFTERAKSVEGGAGRPVKSRAMLLTLWTYAVSRGIGSAREIERQTRSEDGFRWIVGDLHVSHHTLSSFRGGHRRELEGLMTQILGVLLEKGLLTLDRVAQDGTRVRASAAAPSFRSGGSLEECREQARLHVKAVLAEADDPGATKREHAARLAKARDIEQRVDAAIETVKQLAAEGKKEPRASTTDADARVMKMPDGGFRPGYNAQLAVAGSPVGGARTIVGVQVTNVGSDMGSVTPMLRQIERRTGQLPGALLADANHGKNDCIRALVGAGVSPLIAVHKRAAPSNEPAIAAWHALMQSPEGKAAYKARAGLVELVNAHIKSRFDLDQVLVRGLEKVTCVALLGAITFNPTLTSGAPLGSLERLATA
jgi:transposase